MLNVTTNTHFGATFASPTITITVLMFDIRSSTLYKKDNKNTVLVDMNSSIAIQL